MSDFRQDRIEVEPKVGKQIERTDKAKRVAEDDVTPHIMEAVDGILKLISNFTFLSQTYHFKFKNLIFKFLNIKFCTIQIFY